MQATPLGEAATKYNMSAFTEPVLAALEQLDINHLQRLVALVEYNPDTFGELMQKQGVGYYAVAELVFQVRQVAHTMRNL